MGQGQRPRQIDVVQHSIRGVRLSLVQAKKSHYQSRVSVCVLNNHAFNFDEMFSILQVVS